MGNVLGELFGDIASAIREKTGDAEKMKPAQFPEKIRGIETSSGELFYVTFMSYDGTVEYGKKAVATGDDCANPISRGVFDTPIRESTAQYNYTFAGWATEPNGGINSNALKAVDEDRTVYANFVSALRYYTITFYDSDGTTVLATKSVAYGAMPSHTAEKEGFVFDGWVPALATVTGNASYTAVWSENITFADATWADIVRIANAGDAQKYFALGDTKEFSCKDPSGNTVTTTLKIVGFNEDDLADGTGKAPMTIMSMSPLYSSQMTVKSSPTYLWSTCFVRTDLNNSVLNSFPEALRNGIKSVVKNTRKYADGATDKLETTNDKVWIPSCREGGLLYNQTIYYVYPEIGFTNYGGRYDMQTLAESLGIGLWTRSCSTQTNFYTNAVICFSGGAQRWTTTYGTRKDGIMIGFCI